MEEDSASNADDQHIPPSVTAKEQALALWVCEWIFVFFFYNFKIEVQTNKSVATVRGKLIGFSPRIDRIFPSATSKRYLKG